MKTRLIKKAIFNINEFKYLEKLRMYRDFKECYNFSTGLLVKSLHYALIDKGLHDYRFDKSDYITNPKELLFWQSFGSSLDIPYKNDERVKKTFTEFGFRLNQEQKRDGIDMYIKVCETYGRLAGLAYIIDFIVENESIIDKNNGWHSKYQVSIINNLKNPALKSYHNKYYLIKQQIKDNDGRAKEIRKIFSKYTDEVEYIKYFANL
jgi:hypothetical protein